MNRIYYKLFFTLLILVTLTCTGLATVISTFEADTIPRWSIFETDGWFSHGPAMTEFYPLWMNEGGTTFTRLRYDPTATSYLIWDNCIGTTVPASNNAVVVRLRGYAEGTTPNFIYRIAHYGQNASGVTQNWTQIAFDTITTNTWQVVTCNTAGLGLMADLWVWMWGATESNIQGIDVNSITINGNEVPQLDATGSAGAWGYRDAQGWAHGYVSTVDVGPPHNNVGHFEIYTGDASYVGRVYRDLSPWIDGTLEPYLHFDWKVAPGVDPSWTMGRPRLYSQSYGDADWLGTDTNPPTDWTHVVLSVADTTATDTTHLFRPDLWRIDFFMVDLVEDSSNPRLIGYYIDNIFFSDSSTLPQLSPGNTVRLTPQSNQLFTVDGGEGPYTWSVTPPGLGSLDTAHGSSVTFTASTIQGSVTLTVTDVNTISDSVTINITPTSAPIYRDIEDQVLYHQERMSELFE